MSLKERVRPVGEEGHGLPPQEIRIDDEITLVQSHISDAARVYELLDGNRDFLARSFPHVATYTPEDVHKELEESEQATAAGKDAAYLIMRRGVLSGAVGLHDRENGTAIMGYYLAEEATGHRVASRSARALLRFGFGEWGLASVDLHIAAINEESKRVAGSVGAELQPGEQYQGKNGVYDVWRVAKDHYEQAKAA